MLIHKFIWAIFEKLLHRLLQLLFSTEALDLLSELKKKVFASQINQHYFMISWSSLVSCVAPSFTTSSIKSFRLVRFVAQSKTTCHHFPKNNYFHIFFLNCLFVFEDMWRGALLWGNFLFRFPLTSLGYQLNGNSISSFKNHIIFV